VQQQLTIYINDNPHELARGHHTGAELRALAAIPAEEALYRVVGHELHRVSPDHSLELSDQDWFVSHQQLVTVYINEKPVQLAKRRYSGTELKKAGQVPAGDILYRIHGHDRTEIKDAHTIEISNHERFVSLPEVGGAS
jgi:hypothetical protein